MKTVGEAEKEAGMRLYVVTYKGLEE